MDTERVWSSQQKDIFNWFATSEINGTKFQHAEVIARAGSGKTTTIVEAIKYAPERRILLAAFNNKIAEELRLRLSNPNAEAKTLHSVGFACVRRYRTNLRLDKNGNRAESLAKKVCGNSAPDAIVRLVAKLHTKGREIAPHATTYADLYDIAVNFECEPDEGWQNAGFDTTYVIERALEAMELAAQIKNGEEMDFSDMIFLPIRNKWLTKQYDLVVIDEAQDMTNSQLEIAQGVCRGRICIVGDDRQAIYAWRGADSESLARLQVELGAGVMGLNTTYRCGKKIVAYAAEIVPDFFAGENNPEGEILDLQGKDLIECAAPGDFVLSRLNAPLVGTAIGLLRQGKRARIAGRDIGTGLKALVRKLAKGRAANDFEEFMSRVSLWEEHQVAKLDAAKQQARIDAVHDQAGMLIELAETSDSVSQLIDKIDALFTDDGLGQAGVITCSSVHRAKGLEAPRVFVMMDTLRAYNKEELNIQYVAFTRAKTSLVRVFGKARA